MSESHFQTAFYCRIHDKGFLVNTFSKESDYSRYNIGREMRWRMANHKNRVNNCNNVCMDYITNMGYRKLNRLGGIMCDYICQSRTIKGDSTWKKGMYEDNIYDIDLNKINPTYGNQSTSFLKWYLNIQFVNDELDTRMNDPFQIWRFRYNQVITQYKQLLIVGKYYDSKGRYYESYALGDPVNEFNWRQNTPDDEGGHTYIYSLTKYDQEAIGNESFIRKRLPQNYWYSPPKKALPDDEWKEKIGVVNKEYIEATKRCYGLGFQLLGLSVNGICHKNKNYNYKKIGGKSVGLARSQVEFPLPKNYWYSAPQNRFPNFHEWKEKMKRMNREYNESINVCEWYPEKIFVVLCKGKVYNYRNMEEYKTHSNDVKFQLPKNYRYTNADSANKIKELTSHRYKIRSKITF